MKSVVENEKNQQTAQQQRPADYLMPVVNIIETADAYLIEAEMPGVTRAGVEVSLEGNELVLGGHREVKPLAGDPLYIESKPYGYRRVFELDPSIDGTKIHARIDQGLLTLHLPKAEAVKPRKITVGD